MGLNLSKLKNDISNYLISNIIPMFIGTFSILIYTSLLDPSQYGSYSLYNGTFLLATFFIFEWISQGILRFFPKFKENNVIYHLNKSVLYLVILISVPVIFISLIIFLVDYKYIYIIGALFIISSGLLIILNSYIRANLQSQLYKKITLFQSLGNFFISLLILYFYPSFESLFVSKIFTNLLTVLIFIYLNKNKFLFFESKNGKELVDKYPIIKKLMIYGFPIVLTGICSKGLQISDRYFLDFFSDKTTVGVYSANYSISENIAMAVFTPLMMAIHSLLISHYEKKEFESINQVVTKAKKAILLLFTPIIVYILLFHENTSVIFISKDYITGSKIIPIVLVGLTLFNYSLYSFKVYELKEKTYKITKIIVIAFVVNLVLNYFLIKDFEEIGAAIATTFAYGVFFLFSIKMKHEDEISEIISRNSISFSFYRKITLANLLCIVLWLGLKTYYPINPVKVSYLFNILYVILSAVPVYIFYLMITIKEVKELIRT